jgi:SAM-dependent methyltransferase
MSSWFETLFDDRYLKFYPELFDLDRAAGEAAFLDRALSLQSGARILDLGCGFGRHSVPLAALGYRVSGVDRSTPMLNAARTLATERHVEVEWLERDMRNISGMGPFDACVCLYTVFGYFDDPTNESVLRSVCQVLVPGAPFVIDVSNPLPLLARPQNESWREGPFGIRLERSSYDALHGRVTAERLLVTTDGRREELPRSSVRLYAPSELRRMLELGGFEVEVAYGALADEPFVPMQSAKIVYLARKRG